MGNFICPDDDQLTRTATVDLVGTIDLALTWIAQIAMYATLMTTTLILVLKRTRQERPCFVNLQISLLWLS